MNFKINITPILTLSQHGAICNLIKIDDLNLMFDCGSDENFSEDTEKIYSDRIREKLIIFSFLIIRFLT